MKNLRKIHVIKVKPQVKIETLVLFGYHHVLKTKAEILLLQRINISRKSCDFAFARSQKVNNGQDLASAGDQVPKSNVTLLLQGINILKKRCDFASAGSQKVNNGQDLASAGDQVLKSNVTLLLQGIDISKL